MVSKKAAKAEVKVESKQPRDYELTVIISPEVIEERLDAIVDNLSQFVTGKGGSVADIQKWGKRKLAYPLKHFEEGNYILVRFNMEPTFTRELEANLHISEEVLRHLLIKSSN